MAHTDIENLLDEALSGAPAELQSDKPEILVVDDDEGVGEALRLVFGDTYQVSAALTGDAGVALLHPRTMAVVLDVRMRVKDGFDTFVEMKKKVPDVPIIFHSAYQDVRDPYEVMNELRPFGYIKKGDDEALRRAIGDAVDFYRQFLEKEELMRHLEEENARLEALEIERNRELDSLVEQTSSPTEAPSREPSDGET